MDSLQIAFLVLAALLVGAFLPLLAQLYFVLNHLRRGLAETVGDVQRVAERIDRLTGELERDGKLDAMASGIVALSDTAIQLRETLKIASALGGALAPSVAAAVRAWRSEPERGGGRTPGPDGRGGDGEESSHEPKKEASP